MKKMTPLKEGQMKKMTTLVISLLVLMVSAAIAAGYDDGHDEDMISIIAQGRSNISLPQIIGAVAADAKGKVIEARFERLDKFFSFKEGPFVYQVEAITPKGVMEYLVDPADGKIISKRKDRWTYFHDDKIMADLQLTLNQAVIKAEQTTGGRAVSAELEVEDSLAVYQIRMVVDGLSRRILVDPNNGKIYHVNQRPRDDE